MSSPPRAADADVESCASFPRSRRRCLHSPSALRPDLPPPLHAHASFRSDASRLRLARGARFLVRARAAPPRSRAPPRPPRRGGERSRPFASDRARRLLGARPRCDGFLRGGRGARGAGRERVRGEHVRPRLRPRVHARLRVRDVGRGRQAVPRLLRRDRGELPRPLRPRLGRGGDGAGVEALPRQQPLPHRARRDARAQARGRVLRGPRLLLQQRHGGERGGDQVCAQDADGSREGDKIPTRRLGRRAPCPSATASTAARSGAST